MTEPNLLACPFCGGAPELVDDRLVFFVRCNPCKIVMYGENHRHLDSIEDDNEAQKAIDSVDWDKVKQSAIDAWNRWAPVKFELPNNDRFEQIKSSSRSECIVCGGTGIQPSPQGCDVLVMCACTREKKPGRAISDQEILDAMGESLNYADGGYVMDTAKEWVVKAGRDLLAAVGVKS